MKIKLIIFDLDGVLVEASSIHFTALNKALGTKYAITWEEHLSFYDGLKTNQKLKLLSERKGLPVELHEKIWIKKQKVTTQLLREVKPSANLKLLLSKLIQDGYKIAVCSNSIRKTVLTVLSKLDIIEYIDYIVSNEDVKNPKPFPEIYWKAMTELKCTPDETLILEDSPYGLEGAYLSKGYVLEVKTTAEVNYTNIVNRIEIINSQS